MKKLEEYKTPVTVKMIEVYRHKPTFEAWNAICEHARDLERKLAMCRDALREIANTQATRSNIGWMIPADIRDDAQETLKATEPK